MTTLKTFTRADATGEPSYEPGADLGFYLWYDGTTWNAYISGNGDNWAYTFTVEGYGMQVVSTSTEDHDMPPQTYGNGQADVLVLSGRVNASQDGAVFTVNDASNLIVTFSGYSFTGGTERTKISGQNVFLGTGGAIGHARFLIEGS